MAQPALCYFCVSFVRPFKMSPWAPMTNCPWAPKKTLMISFFLGESMGLENVLS